MKKTVQLYEGKAKKVFATDVPDIYIVDYKDDATAFNGEKKGTIAGKGVINNTVTNRIMKMLEEKGNLSPAQQLTYDMVTKGTSNVSMENLQGVIDWYQQNK